MKLKPTIVNAFTREETAPDVAAAFPYRAVLYNLSEGQVQWHWHNEVELFYMPSGALTYHLPGRTCAFYEGDIGFVNADVLHRTTALTEEVSIQHEHIFLPRLLGGLPGDAIQTKYIDPLLQNHAVELIRIPADDPAAPELREWMDRALNAYASQEPGYEMRVRSCLCVPWLEIVRRAETHVPEPVSAETVRIKAMLQYIAAHFSESVTLDEIAAAAHISAREGSRCFKRQLNTTVFEYLLDYRVDRACEMLRGGRTPITEIADRCGFSSPSYFGKVFRERMGMPPREYRNAGEKE